MKMGNGDIKSMTTWEEELADFMHFVEKTLTVFGDANGTTIKAIADSYVELRTMNAKANRPLDLQDFSLPLFSEPFAVYCIRNTVNRRAYIGSALNGFNLRYPGGRWWENHHNHSLANDVLMYGYPNFKVTVWICGDDTDMRKYEAEQIRANFLYTYNVRVEPTPQ